MAAAWLDDDLLAQVQAVQDAALERKQLEAAATAAQRGEIALTRLRYRDAAKHFAAAARRVCSQSADTLPDAAVKVSDSEIRQVRYASWRLGMNLGLAADLSNFRAGEVAPLMKEAETLAVALHVPTPILPKIQHFASALPEFAVYLESDLQCVAARLTSQYGPSYGYLYKFGAVIGHATLYRAQGIASFVPQIQDYGQLAGIPQELWLPMTQGANMRKEVLADVQRLESYIKADP